MPYTPIHWSIAYLGRAIRPQLSLPALLVSTAVPDLEIPFLYIATGGQYSRLVLHSLLGAIVLAVPLSVVFTVYAYSPTISYVFKLNRKTILDRCRFSWRMVAVCLVGSLSHMLIDSLHHEYNPILFPFTYDSFDVLVLANDWMVASFIVQLSFLSLLVFFLVKEFKKGTSGIWERLLVE